MNQPIADDIVAQLEALGIRRDTYALKPTPRIQKFIAQRLGEAAREVPSFPLTMHVRLDALLAARKGWNAGHDARVSVNDLLVKASAASLMALPAVNSSFTPVGLVAHRHADISIAVATDGGLMTPIVRAADTKSVTDISAETRDLAARARIGRLQPDDYVGGTFTVSNLGMFGVSSFGSIINPPQSAILSVGAAEERVVSRGGGFVAETMMTLTMTCDHRIIDGATGARWLADLRDRLEAPDALFG
ncbi:2-oxo acid dehydrogenase subunit E2 [Sphingomonas naphthae]|uniref:2-oxo acid dehydrogenase subunit E2 n=1 Tax=Sphingomonas naphthae TaxID=1813468 RepID=A0ABY7TLB2_9SPHN|nr:2-oxo acid dehydrogenase subunit E2 [Sphingomonas naphthae]WCT73034.1 2-oxo acid dehydrogenase subunit E2 [Sphingomonas naphthae]